MGVARSGMGKKAGQWEPILRATVMRDEIVNTFYERPWLVFLFIVMLVTTVHFGFLEFLGTIEPRQRPVDYEVFYGPVAENILQGRGITLGGTVASAQPPGYPIFLSFVFRLARFLGHERVELIEHVNIILNSFSCIILFLIVERIYTRNVAFIASIIYSTYPGFIYMSTDPDAATLFIPVFFSFLLIFIIGYQTKSALYFAVSGALLGISALVRPTPILMPVALMLYIFFSNPKLRQKIVFITCFSISFIIVLLPWEFYVYRNTGRLIPLSTNGPASVRDGLAFAINPGVGGDRVHVSEDIYAIMKYVATHPQELSNVQQIARFCVLQLTSNTCSFIKLIGIKAARCWYGTDEMWHEREILLLQLPYLLLGILGIYRTSRNKTYLNGMVLLLIIIGYFWIMSIMVLSIVRYMVPAMAFVGVFTSLGLANLYKSCERTIKWHRLKR